MYTVLLRVKKMGKDDTPHRYVDMLSQRYALRVHAVKDYPLTNGRMLGIIDFYPPQCGKACPKKPAHRDMRHYPQT